jgi:aryl-alcohol dehydrogenase-like predicted oxidoreductase
MRSKRVTEKAIQKRNLGKSGLEVSAIGIGCVNLSFGTGKAADIADGV